MLVEGEGHKRQSSIWGRRLAEVSSLAAPVGAHGTDSQ